MSRTTKARARRRRSAADGTGAIEVHPGARIPGIPANSANLRLQYDSGARLMVGTTVAYASTQYAHGDENNRDVHGRIPAYAVANVDAQFRLASNFQLFANVTNLFNRGYENFALL